MSTTELAPLKENQQADLIAAVNECHIASAMKNDTIKSLKLAYGQFELNKVLNTPEVAAMIMSFQNSAIGFLTDNKKDGYSQEIVIQAAQEALTAGAYLHGNEFNIIASRCYLAQSFFIRKVREYCSENLIKRQFQYNCKFAETEGKQKKFKVTVKILWTYPGKEQIEQIQGYNLVGMSEDQVIGKATKRANQWLYNEMTDNNYALAPDESEIIDMVTEDEPKEEKEAKPSAPAATKETVLDALENAANLAALEARYKRAGEVGFGDDNDVHAAYNEKKETFQ